MNVTWRYNNCSTYSTEWSTFHGKNIQYVTICGPGSSVGIAIDYGLDGPGIESRWGAWFSSHVQAGPEPHPASCTMGTGTFPGLKCGRGVLLTTHPLLARGLGRVELYFYPPLGHNRACNGVTLPLYIRLYIIGFFSYNHMIRNVRNTYKKNV